MKFVHKLQKSFYSQFFIDISIQFSPIQIIILVATVDDIMFNNNVNLY